VLSLRSRVTKLDVMVSTLRAAITGELGIVTDEDGERGMAEFRGYRTVFATTSTANPKSEQPWMERRKVPLEETNARHSYLDPKEIAKFEAARGPGALFAVV
jgi:hypothetical protein